MKKLQAFFSHFQFRSLLKALVATLILSFLYNIPYLMAGSAAIDPRLFYGIQVVLSLLSSIGFYKICTLAWTPDKEKLTAGAIGRVLMLQGVLILLVSAVLMPLSTVFASNMPLSIVVQLVSTFVLIVVIPFQLVYYYALFLGKRSWKDIWGFVRAVFARHYRSLLNVYCALILAVMAIDTVTGGPFSLAQGFYVPHIVYNLLYVGNPMFSWMYMLFLTVGFGVPLSSMFAIIFFLFVVGCLYAYLELNFVAFVQKECVDRGTARTQTHR